MPLAVNPNKFEKVQKVEKNCQNPKPDPADRRTFPVRFIVLVLGQKKNSWKVFGGVFQCIEFCVGRFRRQIPTNFFSQLAHDSCLPTGFV